MFAAVGTDPFHFQNQDEEEGADVDDDKFNQHDSLIRRILMGYYNILHKLRWGVLVACAVGLGICIYFALTIKLPTSADVRILDETNQFELNYAWRQELLYDYLRKAGGSRNLAGLGLKPADTGDLSKYHDRLTILKLLCSLTYPQLVRSVLP